MLLDVPHPNKKQQTKKNPKKEKATSLRNLACVEQFMSESAI